ncbi:multidrug-efflux transporter 1 regulator [Clostridium saccharobutylicum]|uniref:MerR family transcriptional regulator n=1 Tax=Clostridium saccharobutylicum TaxID=169679 RepID=UPI0009839F2B|nr:MerR family transcriptional regulator [Clostridium saccharobutylicum]AQS10233.1 multidrug-efflux transporter 1 regulator [Clostridium saccharobutylicum]MBC2436500.1 MerR family transcriptional regulator [Clostridium saccharobutylicum]NSB87630.1 DNA-binding transcriptional MerR regulator [Clostridium saccharobutylicum]NYC31165.1 DNA-binding transcriptional MerR regulator [Clostridium saccharobutylicum]OOM17735.1 multidrug-efflux transporter 1 regulator [Clostridium saccharobutylicum]
MNNFSIGEMSKLHNIWIQTLRYYDKIGLLKPKVINEKSNYRYYTIEQFLQIDIIKYCKGIGLSLEQIKDFIGTNLSMEEILHIINTQQEIMEDKLKEMNRIKNHLDSIKSSISSIIEHEFNKVFIKYNKERKYICYDFISNSSDELEFSCRNVMLGIEKKSEILNYELSTITSYNNREEKITYKNIMINIDENALKDKRNIITLPEGEYLTVYFEGKWFECNEHYNQIIKYINENNIKVNGDFHEIYIFPKMNESGIENTLTQLEILKSR